MFTSIIYTIKPVHTVTSIKQSPALKDQCCFFYLIIEKFIFVCSKSDLLIQERQTFVPPTNTPTFDGIDAQRTFKYTIVSKTTQRSIKNII
jgi:hypothetical protein